MASVRQRVCEVRCCAEPTKAVGVVKGAGMSVPGTSQVAAHDLWKFRDRHGRVAVWVDDVAAFEVGAIGLPLFANGTVVVNLIGFPWTVNIPQSQMLEVVVL